MVLRCSLLGHDYGESEVEREREERGSEVVVTVEEYQECARCGDKHVISENTEVRSISTETESVSRPDEPESAPEHEPAPATEGVETTFIDADEPRPGTTADPASVPEPDTSASSDENEIEIPTDENGDPVTDDGEILEDDGSYETSDRGHGEWPASDDVGPPVSAESGSTDWPDDESEPLDDDAVLLDTGTTTSETTTTFKTELASDEAATDTATPAPAQATDDERGTGIERAREAPTPGSEGGTPADDAPSEFYCPRCEFVASSDRASLRTGDICPDCRKGYLSERHRH